MVSSPFSKIGEAPSLRVPIPFCPFWAFIQICCLLEGTEWGCSYECASGTAVDSVSTELGAPL